MGTPILAILYTELAPRLSTHNIHPILGPYSQAMLLVIMNILEKPDHAIKDPLYTVFEYNKMKT